MALVLFAGEALATQVVPSSPLLKPFYAQYRFSINKVPTTYKASISLESDENRAGFYEMHFQAKGFLLRSEERSQFQWEGCHAKPYRHEFKARGFGLSTFRSTLFDWKNAVAKTEGKKGRQEFPLHPIVGDELSHYMEVRCRLMHGEKDFDVFVAYGSRPKLFSYTVTGQETLKTPMGTVKTLVVERSRKNSERSTTFWIAPDLDYMLVKMHHAESLALQAEMVIRSLDSPDAELADKVASLPQ